MALYVFNPGGRLIHCAILLARSVWKGSNGRFIYEAIPVEMKKDVQLTLKIARTKSTESATPTTTWETTLECVGTTKRKKRAKLYAARDLTLGEPFLVGRATRCLTYKNS